MLFVRRIHCVVLVLPRSLGCALQELQERRNELELARVCLSNPSRFIHGLISNAQHIPTFYDLQRLVA